MLRAVADGWAGGRLVGFDLESTGLDVERDEPVSYAFVEFAGGDLVGRDAGYVQPERPISRGAIEVHKLTRRRLAALDAVPLAVAAKTIATRLAALSAAGIPVVGCNLSYDLTIVDRVLSRLPVPTSLRHEGWHGPLLDVLVLDRALDVDFEARPARRLDALCEHYGLGAPGHDAASDAEAAARVLLAQAARFPALASAGLDELQARQAAWHADYAAERAARRETEGQARLFADVEPWPYLERVGVR
jgi:DNA polymerase III subunit epsilon